MTHDQALRDAVAMISAGTEELEDRCALLEVALESEQRTNAILLETVKKQADDLERLTVSNKRLFAENARIIRTLTGAGNLIKDGVAEVHAARGNVSPLRGAPARSMETDQKPHIVPRSA